MTGNGSFERAATVVVEMSRELGDGDVVATGVASPLAILAIEVAKRTHAPNLTWLACVGAIDPEVPMLRPCSEDLEYLAGRSGQVSIPDLFDHARRGRIDVMFFGAAEVDGKGNTNLTASGSLEQPRYKFPGVAGAATLRRWVHRPVLLVPRQSRRNLVSQVQVASTTDPQRRTRLLTNLGTFDLGSEGARLVRRHPWADTEKIDESTDFAYSMSNPLPVTPPPEPEYLDAIRDIDKRGLSQQIVG